METKQAMIQKTDTGADVSIEELMEYEDGELSTGATILMFSRMVRNGMAWSLQGSYGRYAHNLILQGVLERNGDITDYGADLMNEDK